MNNFIMFAGPPCAGKTTFIEKNQVAITNTYGVDSVLSSDAVIEDIAYNRGLTYSEIFKGSIDLATDYVNVMLGILSMQQRNFILDQTNCTAKSRKKKLDKLYHPANYNKIIVVFNDIQESEYTLRNMNRAEETGKRIPDAIMESMIKSFEFPTYDEDFTKIYTEQEFLETLKPPENAYGGMIEYK